GGAQDEPADRQLAAELARERLPAAGRPGLRRRTAERHTGQSQDRVLVAEDPDPGRRLLAVADADPVAVEVDRDGVVGVLGPDQDPPAEPFPGAPALLALEVPGDRVSERERELGGRSLVQLDAVARHAAIVAAASGPGEALGSRALQRALLEHPP